MAARACVDQAARRFEVLDCQVDRSRKKPEEATPEPAPRTVRIKRERLVNQCKRPSDILAENIQRARGEHEHRGIVRGGGQRPSDKIKTLALGGVGVVGPATPDKLSDAPCR